MKSTPDRRLPRACKRCGFVRVVLIRDEIRFVPDGTTRMVHGAPSPNGEFQIVGESYTPNCTACEYELNARKYFRLADVNQRRAQETRALQAKRKK
jgi:hypothetical protein